MTISHEFFGELDFSPKNDDVDVIDKKVEFKNHITRVRFSIHNKKFLTQENLDKLANFVQNIDKFDRIAQEKLIFALENEEKDYIQEHIEEMSHSKILQKLGDNFSVQNFANAMKLEMIWLNEEDSEVYFDYMIDKNNSDQILVVRFDMNGNFLEVAWES